MMILWKQCRYITDIIPIISILGDTVQISVTLASRASNEGSRSDYYCFHIWDTIKTQDLVDLVGAFSVKFSRTFVRSLTRDALPSYCCSRRYWHNILIHLMKQYEYHFMLGDFPLNKSKRLEVCEKSISPIKMSKIVTMSRSISILNIHLSFVFFGEKLPFYTKDILLS